MARRLLRISLLLGLVGGCSDEGPQVPLLFVQPAEEQNGAGTITSAPGGINCTVSNQTSIGACSANFEPGSAVTLIASPAAGSSFTGWGGECAGTDPTCNVTLDASADVTAGFALANPRRLTVTGSGTGGGTISSVPGGLTCSYDGNQTSGTCAADFADGAVVTLTAAAAVGTGFNSWADDCAGFAGSPTCDLTMSDARSASAEFVSVSFSGLMASATNDQSGLIVVNVPVASARVARTAPNGVSLGTAATDVVAIGTIRFLDGEPTTVAGVYDTESKSLQLSSSAGFDLNARFSGEIFDGLFFDPVTGAGGPTTLVAAPRSSPPTVYCGTFDGDDSGSWNVVVAGTLVSGARSGVEGNSRSMVGSVAGDQLTLTVYTGTPPDSSGTGNATGTISTDGTSIDGAWSEFIGGGGTWQASTTGCD